MSKVVKSTKKKVKRKHIRFAAEEGTLAYVITDADGKKLKVPIPCIVSEESYGGCSLVALKNNIFHEEAEFKIKVGQLSPMVAQVRWVRSYDGKVSLVGIAYLE